MRASQAAPFFNRGHNLSHMHNWTLLCGVIINPCVSHGATSVKGNTTAASFTALKRCNNRKAQLWWGVYTPAARSLNRRSSFQSGLSSPLPGDGSPSPAVVLRDILRACLCMCACVCMCVCVSLFLLLSSLKRSDSWTFSYILFHSPSGLVHSSCQNHFC